MTDKKELTTRTLENEIVNVDDQESLDRFLGQLDHAKSFASFIDYFHSLKQVKDQSEADLCRKSGIERTYCYHILNGTKAPGRDKIIRLCIAASLDETQTRRALEAGKSAPFYAKSRRDAVIRYAIRQHLSVIDTDILLEDYGLERLE